MTPKVGNFAGHWSITFGPLVGPGNSSRLPFGEQAVLNVVHTVFGGVDFVLTLKNGHHVGFTASEVSGDPPRLEARGDAGPIDRVYLFEFLAFFVERFSEVGPLLVGTFVQHQAVGEDPPETGGWVGNATVPDPRR